MRIRRPYFGAAAFVAAALGAAVWFAIEFPRQAPLAPSVVSKAANETRAMAHSPRNAGYLSDTTCTTCHSEIAEAYRHNGMARSFKDLHESAPLGELTGTDSSMEDSRQGYQYRAFIEQGRVVQEESQLQRRASGGHKARQVARFSVGSGDHAQSFVAERNGYLYQLPLAWFADEQLWKFSPGYELMNRRFDRPITPGCIACHGTNAAHREPTRNRYELPIHDGISCQRCHGPGAKHVAYWNERKDRSADKPEEFNARRVDGVSQLVNPGKLSPDLANDICLQCHLQGDVTLHQPGHDAFSFRPGRKLSDHRLDFLVRTDKPDAFGVASHGARMMRSRCYLEGERKLTCMHCHDPHVSIRDVTREFFDARCADCHAPESCGREASAAEKKVAAGCVKCHMPQRATREGQHLVFTEHWIQRRPVVGERNPAVLAANTAVELIPIWPAADPKQIRLGSAYVLLHETMGPQLSSLERGVSMLSEAHRQGNADADARYWLASGLISRYQARPAIALLQELLREEPDRWQARLRLGIAHDQLREYERAIVEYEQIVQAAPDWMEPYPLLARLYLFRKDADKAVRLLEQQIRYNPDATTWTYLAAARSLQAVPPHECLKLVDSALALDPRHIPALLAQGQFRLQAGDNPGAAESFQSVLTIDPANASAQSALQQLR